MNPSVGVPTVLVVDDEPDILEAMREFLATSLPQARVLAASSGAQGLAILGRDDVDLILTDYKMPGMNGIDFLKAAHRLRPEIPCLLITAYDLDARAQRAVQPEIIGLFPKPVDPGQMLNQVRSLLQPAAG